MFLKKRNETPQPDRAGNPSGCGVFLCFFLHKIACRLCVLTQYGRLLLVGEGIRIVSYSGEEMRVEGRIDQVTFQ